MPVKDTWCVFEMDISQVRSLKRTRHAERQDHCANLCYKKGSLRAMTKIGPIGGVQDC